MQKTVLLTLGRLPKGLDLARSFHRAGYRVLVAEPFRWHLMRVSKTVSKSFTVTPPTKDPEAYLEDLLRIIRREKVSLVVPISEETMYVAALKDRVESGVSIYSMPQEQLLSLHDKLRFIEQAEAMRLPVPETYRLADPRAARLANTHDHVLKPTNSCAGKGIQMKQQGTPLPDDADDHATIVQRRVEGWHASSFSLVHEGRVLLTVIYRGTIMTGTVAVGFERLDGQNVMEAWIETFASGVGYSGFIAFDFIVDDQGMPYAIECNPRVTSGIHFVANDIIAPIMLYPNRESPPRLRPERRFHQFWPCLTETQASIFRWSTFRQHLGNLIRSRDVTWKERDPLPFLLMPFTSMNMLWTAMTTEKTLGEAATDDIEWLPDAAGTGGTGPNQEPLSPGEAAPGT